MNETNKLHPQSDTSTQRVAETASTKQPSSSEDASEEQRFDSGVSVETWAAMPPAQRAKAEQRQQAYAAMDRACEWTLSDDGVLHLTHHDYSEVLTPFAATVEKTVAQTLSHFEQATATLSEEERIQSILQLVTKLIGTDVVFSSRAMRRIVRNMGINFDGARAVEQEYALSVIDDLLLLFGFIAYHDSSDLTLSDEFNESFRRGISAASRILTGDYEEREYEIALLGGDLVLQTFDCIDKWHLRYSKSPSVSTPPSGESSLPERQELEHKATRILEIAYRELTAILGSAPDREATRIALASPYGATERRGSSSEKGRLEALVDVLSSAGVSTSVDGIHHQLKRARSRKRKRDQT